MTFFKFKAAIAAYCARVRETRQLHAGTMPGWLNFVSAHMAALGLVTLLHPLTPASRRPTTKQKIVGGFVTVIVATWIVSTIFNPNLASPPHLVCLAIAQFGGSCPAPL
jgi:hypothetical protein